MVFITTYPEVKRVNIVQLDTIKMKRVCRIALDVYQELMKIKLVPMSAKIVQQDSTNIYQATPHALNVQWVGHQIKVALNVNRATLVHTVTSKVKNVKIVMLGSIVKVKKVMV